MKGSSREKPYATCSALEGCAKSAHVEAPGGMPAGCLQLFPMAFPPSLPGPLLYKVLSVDTGPYLFFKYLQAAT